METTPLIRTDFENVKNAVFEHCDWNNEELELANLQEYEDRQKLLESLIDKPLGKYWVNYNANPLKQKTGDCVTRALSVAFDTTYNDILTLQQMLSTNIGIIQQDSRVYSYLLKDWLALDVVGGDRNGRTILFRDLVKIMRKHNDLDNVYLVASANHIAVITLGYLIDDWDSENEPVRTFYIHHKGNFSYRGIPNKLMDKLLKENEKERKCPTSVQDFFDRLLEEDIEEMDDEELEEMDG